MRVSQSLLPLFWKSVSPETLIRTKARVIGRHRGAHRQIDVVFAKPFRQSRHLQKVTQRFIRTRDPQFDPESLQVRIQSLQRLRRRRIEITDGFRIENDTLQSRPGVGDQLLRPLGKERRVREDKRRIER